jgi:hypothetical protein
MQEIVTVIALMLIAVGSLAVFPAAFMAVTDYINLVFVILAFYGIQAVYQYFTYLKKFDLFPGVISDKFLVGFFAIFWVGWLAANFIVAMDWYIQFVIWILGSLGLLKLSSKA